MAKPHPPPSGIRIREREKTGSLRMLHHFKKRMYNASSQRTLPLYWNLRENSADLFSPSSPGTMGAYQPPSPTLHASSSEQSSSPLSLADVYPQDPCFNPWATPTVAENRSVPAMDIEIGTSDAAVGPPTPPLSPQTAEPVHKQQEEEEEEQQQQEQQQQQQHKHKQQEGEEEQQQQQQQQEDEVDGWFSSQLVKTVKTALLHLFNVTCVKYVKDTCYGCHISHPSQRHHQCLNEMEQEYIQTNFADITRKMLTPKFLPAVQNLLLLKNIHEDDLLVKTVVKTLMHELKFGHSMYTSIQEMYQEMSDDQQLKELKAVSRCYGLQD